jgi:hypothetical protein
MLRVTKLRHLAQQHMRKVIIQLLLVAMHMPKVMILLLLVKLHMLKVWRQKQKEFTHTQKVMVQ